jgi:hypothetical protein
MPIPHRTGTRKVRCLASVTVAVAIVTTAYLSTARAAVPPGWLATALLAQTKSGPPCYASVNGWTIPNWTQVWSPTLKAYITSWTNWAVTFTCNNSNTGNACAICVRNEYLLKTYNTPKGGWVWRAQSPTDKTNGSCGIGYTQKFNSSYTGVASGNTPQDTWKNIFQIVSYSPMYGTTCDNQNYMDTTASVFTINVRP